MSTVRVGVGGRQQAASEHEGYAEATTAESQRFADCLFGSSNKTASDEASPRSEPVRAMAQPKNMCAHGIEKIRLGEQLTYRLTNGPMMGLVIQAAYEGQGINLAIYPANGRQSRVMSKLLPKISGAMKGRPLPVTLSVMPVTVSDTGHGDNQRSL